MNRVKQEETVDRPGTQALRILWVKVGGLWPAHSGGRLRSFHVIKELSRRHHVSVITTHSPGESEEALSAQLPDCRQVRSLPYHAAKRDSWRFIISLMVSWLGRLPVDLYRHRIKVLRDEVGCMLEEKNFDLCVVDFLTAVPNLPSSMDIPVIHFSHNVEYMIWKRLYDNERSVLKRAALALEWRKMRWYEEAACRRFDMTVTVSRDDRVRLQQSGSVARLRDIPTGVDTDYFCPTPDARQNPLELVFCGSMDWHPNEDAMRYFIDAILPLIRLENPNVSLTIVGRNPPAWLKSLSGSDGVTVSGTVDDVRPWIAGAAVYLVPLRIGGGTRLKIYEALAMGKAVVSTTIGAEGLPLKEGVHILRADTPSAFAYQVLTLLERPGLREQMGREGRDLMVNHYSWSRVGDSFETLCREAVDSSLKHSKTKIGSLVQETDLSKENLS